MRALIVGLGSIGRRHAVNLQKLGHIVCVVDPFIEGVHYESLGNFAEDRETVDFAVVCSPTECHIDHCIQLINLGIPVLCEKPLYSWDQHDRVEKIVSALVHNPRAKFAVAYCYRFHPQFRHLKQIGSRVEYLSLYACDNLVSKYGPTALDTMASHSIDAALWCLGPARTYEVHNSGERVSIQIVHNSGAVSQIHCDITTSPRIAQCNFELDIGTGAFGIERYYPMYEDEIKAWLNYLETGDRGDLCSFDEAMRVQEVMWG